MEQSERERDTHIQRQRDREPYREWHTHRETQRKRDRAIKYYRIPEVTQSHFIIPNPIKIFTLYENKTDIFSFFYLFIVDLM